MGSFYLDIDIKDAVRVHVSVLVTVAFGETRTICGFCLTPMFTFCTNIFLQLGNCHIPISKIVFCFSDAETCVLLL